MGVKILICAFFQIYHIYSGVFGIMLSIHNLLFQKYKISSDVFIRETLSLKVFKNTLFHCHIFNQSRAVIVISQDSHSGGVIILQFTSHNTQVHQLFDHKSHSSLFNGSRTSFQQEYHHTLSKHSFFTIDSSSVKHSKL